MRKFVLVFYLVLTVLFCGCSLISCGSPAGPGDENGGNNGGNNGGGGEEPPVAGLSKLDIAIRRADQTTPGQFIFGTNNVSGATAYNATKGGAPVGTSATNLVSVSSSELGDLPFTALSAKAVKGAEDASLATALPGIGVYNAATPTLEGYTDWFNFLSSAIWGLNRTGDLTYNILRTTIQGVLNAAHTTEGEWQGIEDYYNSNYPGELDDATAAVLAAYNRDGGNSIMDWFKDPDGPSDVIAAAPGHLKTILELLPRLWLNSVPNPANIEAMRPIVEQQIKAAYPDVKTVE